MFSEIAFSTWNIHGLINKVLGDKTKNKDFVEAISNIDFMFLTETWNNQDINIPGFETINSNLAKPKSKYACRQSGGISLIFKSKFKNFVSIVKNTKNFIWSKISKEILSSDTDLYICGTYIPPEKSKYFDPEIFEEFENDNDFGPTRSSSLIYIASKCWRKTLTAVLVAFFIFRVFFFK